MCEFDRPKLLRFLYKDINNIGRFTIIRIGVGNTNLPSFWFKNEGEGVIVAQNICVDFDPFYI